MMENGQDPGQNYNEYSTTPGGGVNRSSSLPAENASGRKLFNTEQEIYQHEKLLLEQDAHLLEEQRYLNRLKNSELRQNKNLTDHYQQVTRPMLERKRMLDELENQQMNERMQAYSNYNNR